MAEKNNVDKYNEVPLCEAAMLFKEEVLQIMPDIPHEQLVDMVTVYIFYHYHIDKETVKRVITMTCF